MSYDYPQLAADIINNLPDGATPADARRALQNLDPLAQAAALAATTGAKVANVKTYLPNGTPTGVDDTSYFASAFSAVGAGGTVYAPRNPNPYILNNVPFTAEGQTLAGDGYSLTTGTVLKAKAAATNVLRLEGKRYCCLRNLVIDGNSRASRGLLYQATGPGATAQSLLMERVMFYRCTRGWHVGPGAGGVNQADKSTLINCLFVECDYGIYQEPANSQATLLINCNFSTTYQTSIHMLGGTLTMHGGMFQGGTGPKGVECASGNVDWIRFEDVIFEGPTTDLECASFTPRDGITAVNTIFQGVTYNMRLGTNGRLFATECRFNDSTPPGGGIISCAANNVKITLRHCVYGKPALAGAGAGTCILRDDHPASVASVASAAALPLPQGRRVVTVTGTTAITSIPAGPVDQEVSLVFAGALTLTDGSNLKLAGDFVTSADDSITLVSDGTNWIETGRSVN